MNMRMQLFYRANYTLIANDLSVKELKLILAERRVNYQHLLEKQEFAELVIKTTPKSTGPIHGRWKASYIAAELDSKRTTIEKHELCSKKWSFRFKQWPQDQAGLSAKFKEDYTYQSDLLDGDMRWRFYAGDVQVEQYPPLKPSRTRDWGWRLDNDFVVFFETNS